MLRHAVRRAQFAFGGKAEGLAEDLRAIMADYREVWLARNRPGGLKDSLARLEPALADYGTA
jgi:hypothetical protein